MLSTGQKVVALCSLGGVLVKDKIYTITWEYTCSCGQQTVSFGVKHWLSPNALNPCDKCGNKLQTTPEWTCNAENFAPHPRIRR